jgi:hypothetical protein
VIKNLIVDDVEYRVTNERIIHSDEELIFEIKDDNGRVTYVKGLFDDMLGHPIKDIWKILNTNL